MTGSEAPTSFRLAYVPGVTPAKWVRIWRERLPDVPLTLVPVSAAEAPDLLRAGGADAGLVRSPADRTGPGRTDLSAIPLYTETTVVVVPKDHVVTAADAVSAGDLSDDVLLHPLDDVLAWERLPGRPARERPATTADAMDLVAAGVGLLVIPQSLARLHHRRDLTYRPVADAPESGVALSWPQDGTTDLVEEFIGIVRGRTVNSWRGRTPPPSPAGDDGTRDDKDKPRRKAAPAARSGGAPARKTPRKPAAGGRSAAPKGNRRGRPRRPS